MKAESLKVNDAEENLMVKYVNVYCSLNHVIYMHGYFS